MVCDFSGVIRAGLITISYFLLLFLNPGGLVEVAVSVWAVESGDVRHRSKP